MAKVKKISVSYMDKIAKENENIIQEEYHSSDVILEVKKVISFTEYLDFVDCVVKSCFQENDEYTPELKDFAIRRNVIEKYTNVTLPENIEHQYMLLYVTDLFYEVKSLIDRDQFVSLLNSIDDKVEYIANSHVAIFNVKANEVMSALDNATNSMEQLFGKVSGDQVASMVGKLATGNIDEASIMRAYLEAKKDGSKEFKTE